MMIILLRKFRESQEALAGEDTKRIDFKGVAEREQLRLRKLSALRAGDAHSELANKRIVNTASGAADFFKSS
ncbi:MAG: hypothetical protein CM15mV81_150 [uncultured marine virus]|nr:MAG: hypothetical protein CM15mV81_150 [uncultured marine virus]